jgi:hypothetical protein
MTDEPFASVAGAMTPSAAEPEAREAIGAIVSLLGERPLVGFCELHRSAAQHRFLRTLILDPRFGGVADAVVVEFGNARHQALVDRFVAGERVPPEELERAWRETTQRTAWETPDYRRFFATVQSANRLLPASRRLRVLLGDPPIDWATIRSEADLDQWYGMRSRHFAAVVERQILARDRRALLIAGGFHLFRGVPHNETALLERRRPECIHVVAVEGEAAPLDDPPGRLAHWPVPALARLACTWLGELPLPLAGEQERNDAGGVRLAQAADAYLHLGVDRRRPSFGR